MFLEHPQQLVLGLVVFLQRKQWTYFLQHEHSIQAGTLTNQNLEIHRRPKEPVHVERRCSRACCSTRPDHCCRCDGKGTSRALSMRSSDAHSAKASSSARSSCQRRRSSTWPVSTHRLTYSRSSSVVTSIRITARRREVDSKSATSRNAGREIGTRHRPRRRSQRSQRYGRPGWSCRREDQSRHANIIGSSAV
jgi:hypothetical protein